MADKGGRFLYPPAVSLDRSLCAPPDVWLPGWPGLHKPIALPHIGQQPECLARRREGAAGDHRPRRVGRGGSLQRARETSSRPLRARVEGSAKGRGPCRPPCATSGRRRRGWRSCWRWRVPQCFAASLCSEPARSSLPDSGRSGGLVGRTVEMGTTWDVLRGLQPRCAHISPRAPIPQGAAAGVSSGL